MRHRLGALVGRGQVADGAVEPSIGVLAFVGVGDADQRAFLVPGQQQQGARVTGLAAPERVKNRTVERDALRRDGGDGRAALGQVGVGAK